MAEVRYYCPKCGEFTPHFKANHFDQWGHLVSTVDRCRKCNGDSATHEAPLGDVPTLRDAGITPMEYRRLEFLKWEIARGIVNEEGYRVLPGGYVLYTSDYS